MELTDQNKKIIAEAEEFVRRLDDGLQIVSPRARNLERWYKEPNKLSEKIADILYENKKRFRYSTGETERYNIAKNLLEVRDVLQTHGYLENGDASIEENRLLREENSKLKEEVKSLKEEIKQLDEELAHQKIGSYFVEGDVGKHE